MKVTRRKKIRDYSKLIEKSLEERIDKHQKANEQISLAKSMIMEVKKIGIDPVRPLNLLKLCKNKLKNAKTTEDYDKAINYANNAVKTCKKMIQEFTDAKASMKEARSAINVSKKYIDITDSSILLEQSKVNMDSGNYSESLKITKKIIKQIDKIKADVNPKIVITVPEVPEFTSGSWLKFSIILRNKSKVHARELRINLAGEVETKDIEKIADLKSGDEKKVTIPLKTKEVGELPLTITVLFINPITTKQLEANKEIWVRTVEEERKFDAAQDTLVKALSAVEFYQGYVRLKVGIKNEMDTVITDVKLDLEYDNKAFRFDIIEPNLMRMGNKITFGNINPGEKRTAAIYLDPIICTESNIDANVTFKDVYGELRTTSIKRRKAEVVCPIFYTPENINTAMLRRLIDEELPVTDSKIYEIPEGLDVRRASGVCKEVIQGHDLQLVREFSDDDIYGNEIESWYYGLTKVKKNSVIIKSSVREKTNTIELFVACNNKQVLTGFLAELSHSYNNKLQELGFIDETVYPIADSTTREEVKHTDSILAHKYIDKAVLSLSKRGNEYEVGFKTSEKEGEASEVFEFIKVSPDTRADIIKRVEKAVTISNIFVRARGTVGDVGDELIESEAEKLFQLRGFEDSFKSKTKDNIENLSSLGKLIYSMFLPEPIQNYLENIKEPLILKTNDNEIPWELLHDDTDFLSLKVPVGRRLRSRVTPKVNPIVDREKIRLLFIANATCDLIEAEKEVEFIKSKLSSGVEIDMLHREEATNAAILTALKGGNYDIIHYAGHAEFNPKSPDESALISANEGKVYAQEIRRVLRGKPFVFLNACSSGKEKICEDDSSYTGSDTEGLASSFIFGGALGFLGSSWPTPDISAGILAAEFYTHFLKGESIGESLRKARLHLRNTRPEDVNWSAFTLYGDPTLTLSKKVDN